MGRHKSLVISVVVTGVEAMLLPSCNGMFEDVYDSMADDYPGGKSASSEQSDVFPSRGTLAIDATSYTEWNYIDFHNGVLSRSSISLEDKSESDVPLSWDLAIHRYDAKTNGASVTETNYESIDELLSFGLPADAEWEPDSWSDSKVTIDMSHMMDGYLEYLPSPYNAVLGRWLDVDTSTMPPIYTMSGKVYVVAFPDGTKAALKLVNYMDAKSVKGHMTIEYVYPLDF